MIILQALMRGWGDLLRPRVLRLVAMGIGLTILLFIALQAGVFWLIRLFAPDSFSLPWIGPVEIGHALSWSSLALFPIMGFFLMAPVAAAFAGLFTENVAEAVEDIHYPGRRGKGLDFMDGVLESLAVMAAVLGVAILSLILTPFLGPIAPIILYAANGWLLGREFFQMAARRHLPEDQASALRKSNSGRITMAGALVAVALTIPLVNIAVPLLAAACFTHLFHLLSAADGRNSQYRPG
jgi:CysZ protein